MYRQVEKFQLRTVRGMLCISALANSKEEAEKEGFHYMFHTSVDIYGKCLDKLGHRYEFCMVEREEYLQRVIEKFRVEPPYKIWQLKMDLPDARRKMFISFDKVQNSFDAGNYECVYSGAYHNESLEKIFINLNTQIPSGYRGHSLSVSDVVEIKGKYFYVDSYGFVDVTDKWKQ